MSNDSLVADNHFDLEQLGYFRNRGDKRATIGIAAPVNVVLNEKENKELKEIF